MRKVFGALRCVSAVRLSVVLIIFPYLTGFGLVWRARLPLPGGARDVPICAASAFGRIRSTPQDLSLSFALVSASSNHESTRQGKHHAAVKGGGGCGVAAPYEEDGKSCIRMTLMKPYSCPRLLKRLVLQYGFVTDGLLFLRHCHNAVCPVADNVVVLRQVGRRRQRSRMETPGYHYLHVLVGQGFA